MKTLTFVRHAESLANAGGITMPNAEIPLSPCGHDQARQLAELLDVQPTQVLVSSFVRTLETSRWFCDRVGATAVVHPLLHEFSSIDHLLIQDMDLAQRRPMTVAYWSEADPDKRMGENAETFREFAGRVIRFHDEMESLPDGTVVFGHGIWLALLFWRLQGFATHIDSDSMRAFRIFQLALPMPNCATYDLHRGPDGSWLVEARFPLPS